MATAGCGCKICKAGLGDYTNELISIGESARTVLDMLQEQGLQTNEKLLKKHLAAYSMPYPEKPNDDDELLHCEPVRVDLNKIDFSEYNFKPDNIESIVGYLQNINLKIYLNQSQITLQAQEDVINGIAPNVPKEVMQNQMVAFQMYKESSGIMLHVNQQEAIKSVESQGLIIQQPTYLLTPNAQTKTQCETN